MKKLLIVTVIAISGVIAPATNAEAQTPVLEVIKAGVKKVIRAVDLKIQRLQNQTIWLQNAQKVLEIEMSKVKLQEIAGWVERQKTLYYEELYQVKAIISYYQRIKDIGQKQVRLVEEYKRAWKLFRQDKHFSPAELMHMSKVYAGILTESSKNIDQIILVVNSFQTRMSDASRLEIINEAADRADTNYYDLLKFNQQNVMLSMQRAKAQNDVDAVKKLYGL
jgi:hypothetical protein